MGTRTIRSAYGSWPGYAAALRDVVADLTDGHLALQPSPERWPLWATIGHLACQRVSWLCGFAGEPGAETTPFPDALHRCPGDEYLEPAMGSVELVDALDRTFLVIDAVLDRWTFETLDEPIVRRFGDEEWAHTRGWVIQRVFAHDLTHIAELNEAFTNAGLPPIDLWSG